MIIVPFTIGDSGFRSVLRYLVVVFPACLIFAQWAERRSVDLALTASLALVQGVLFVVWLTYWTRYII